MKRMMMSWLSQYTRANKDEFFEGIALGKTEKTTIVNNYFSFLLQFDQGNLFRLCL
jgi:hypothetical protein